MKKRKAEHGTKAKRKNGPWTGQNRKQWYERIEILDTHCWRWTGAKTQEGYGLTFAGGRKKRVYAHRAFYERFKGPIPRKLQLDHLCRNTWCVNPSRLEPVTCRENLLRGKTSVAENTAKTYCVNSHPFNDENTITVQGSYGPKRQCRTCKRERMNKYRRKAGISSRPPRGPYRRK